MVEGIRYQAQKMDKIPTRKGSPGAKEKWAVPEDNMHYGIEKQ